MKKIVFVMGVSGCGKSTVGQLLAATLEIPFFDGDDFHPEENKVKMKNELPLNDNDREGWLHNLHDLAKKELQKNGCVITCSALKDIYRKTLQNGFEDQSLFVYLKGSYDLIHSRMQKRSDHFMPASLLKSQFDTLEEPTNALTISIKNKPESIVKTILSFLSQSQQS